MIQQGLSYITHTVYFTVYGLHIREKANRQLRTQFKFVASLGPQKIELNVFGKYFISNT